MGALTAPRMTWALVLAIGLGCSSADTAAPLVDGFYLQADRGSSIHLLQILEGRRHVISGQFERIEIRGGKSLFRVVTPECGTIDFVLKPGNEVECATCAQGVSPVSLGTCPFTGDRLPVEWQYLGN